MSTETFSVQAAEHDGLPEDRRRWAAAAIFTTLALAALDTAIANIALPAIAADLHASAADVIWVVNIYQIAMVATLLPLAALGEIAGHERLYIGGLILFTLSSLACACADSLTTLVVARGLQGLGASGMMSVNAALVRFIYPERQLGRGLGNNALVVAIALSLGPTIASGILSVASWSWLFAVNVPIGLLAIVVGWHTLPRIPRAGHSFDGPGALMAACCLGLFIVGLSSATHGGSLVLAGAELAGAVIVGVLLTRRQRHHPAPMLPIDLFRRPMFTLSAATAMCAFAAQGLAFVSLPFYFEDVLGRSQVETGFFMTPWPVVVGIMAPIAGRLSDRYPVGILGGIGLALMGLGLTLLALLPASPNIPDIIWRMAVCGIGFGFYQAPNLKALMSSAPPGRSGSASGIVATARLTGQTSGAALAALCFVIAGREGATLALALGAGFAALGCVMSLLRLGTAPGPGARG